jgi:branched-chain amino acid transport system substrate-binding protein
MPLPVEPLLVRIAIGAPLSGRSALLGCEMAQAARLAIDEHNARGSAVQIATMVLDDAGDPNRGLAVATDAIRQREVLGVIGHYNSDVTIAVSTAYAQAGLAMITPIASSPVVTDRHLPGIFRWTNRDDRTAIAIAAYLRGARQKRRAIIVESETAYAASMAEHFARAFTAAGGEVIMRRTIRRRHALRVRGAGFGREPQTSSSPTGGRGRGGSADIDAIVRQLPQDFDLLFYGGSFDGAPLLTAMRMAGRMQLFAAGDGCWDVKNFVEPAGVAATAGEGVLVLAATLAVGRMLGSVDFATRYTSRYGPIGNYALNAHDATWLLIDAILDAARHSGGLPERGAVIDAIRRSAYQGLAYRDPVRWDDKGDNLASLTALNIVRTDRRFEQIAEIAGA